MIALTDPVMLNGQIGWVLCVAVLALASSVSGCSRCLDCDFLTHYSHSGNLLPQIILFIRGKQKDPSLLSQERLDRASPELWPEQIPGVSEFAATLTTPDTSPPKWKATIQENIDTDMLQEFGSLTTSQLLEKVRGLQNLAYQLGLEEAREMTRGKFLNILDRSDRKT